jgi:excinuclease ABC A subunit
MTGSTSCPQLNDQQNQIAVRILKEIRDRLKFLNDVGLDYLTLSRNSGTLSGGESQRIRLASQIGSGLTGVLYVLDEPSIGLHQRDNARLLETLKHLRDLGNTVIVVEHDEDAILTADYVVDIGPAGVHGGEIIAQGTPGGHGQSGSITGKYLSGELAVEVPSSAANRRRRSALKVSGARGNNLKNVSASVPLGLFTAVTGVSGGGKSTFLIETLYKAAAQAVNGRAREPGRIRPDRRPGTSTRSSTSTSRRSAARRAPTRPPTPAPSPRSATGSPACRKPRRAATSPAGSRSTSRAAAARPARATASSRSRCTSCPTST